MWTIASLLILSLVQCKVGPLGRCEPGQVDLYSSAGTGGGRTVFCHGLLLLGGSYVVLPAHCVVAANKLPGTVQLRDSRGRSVKIELGSALVHPEFRLISFDKRDILPHDIALLPVRNRARHGLRPSRRRSARLATGPPQLEEEERRFWLTQSQSESSLSPPGLCHPAGLSPGQLCLTRTPTNSSSPPGLDYLGQGELPDPGQGHYWAACLHTSGLAVTSSDTSRDCRLEALLLTSSCHLSSLLALDIRLYRDWIRAAILADTLRHLGQPRKRRRRRRRRRRNNSPTRGLFLQELRSSRTCPPLPGKDVHQFHGLDRKTHLGTPEVRTVVQKPPEFASLPSPEEDLRVITDCGVEVRLEAGVIQSPIHYRDVTTYRELVALLQQDYKYRVRNLTKIFSLHIFLEIFSSPTCGASG